jgi:toxin FitB
VKYLLDNNVISEVSKHDKADANVVAWYNSVEQDSVCLSVLVIGEIRAGIEKLRVDRPKRASDFERRLILTIDLFADRIISIDRRVAERWGRLNAERKRAAVVALLAATAWVHGLVMVTRNIRNFADTDVACLNPFEFRH